MDDEGPHLRTLLIDAPTRRETIDAMLSHLADAGDLCAVDLPEVRTEIERRESLGTTAIGQGVAMPHVKHASLAWPVVAIARLTRPGLDWDSIDGEPVDLVFLVAAPRDDHRRAGVRRFFECLMRGLAKGPVETLRRANTPGELGDAVHALTSTFW
jgi:mannitol/fructose-specific phosphotransferase system IIA component (Ntr-type)